MNKYFLVSLLVIFVSCFSENDVSSKSSKVMNKVETNLPKEIAEEDCDDKAEKEIEIKEETISLTGGDTGCSLDEI